MERREHGCFKGGCIGATVGGCAIPTGFAIFAIIVNDGGGPLFWPILMFAGAVSGLLLGALVQTIRQHWTSRTE